MLHYDSYLSMIDHDLLSVFGQAFRAPDIFHIRSHPSRKAHPRSARIDSDQLSILRHGRPLASLANKPKLAKYVVTENVYYSTMKCIACTITAAAAIQRRWRCDGGGDCGGGGDATVTAMRRWRRCGGDAAVAAMRRRRRRGDIINRRAPVRRSVTRSPLALPPARSLARRSLFRPLDRSLAARSSALCITRSPLALLRKPAPQPRHSQHVH